MANVLIVDDDDAFRDDLAARFRERGHQVESAGTVAEARDRLAHYQPDLLLLDIMLPDGTGLELLPQLDGVSDDGPHKTVIMTGHAAVKRIISRMGGPSVAFSKKPLDAEATASLMRMADRLRTPGSQLSDVAAMVGECQTMRVVYASIRKVAPTESTVFIQGESGTGKELVAEAIHRLSGRTGEFVAVNCGGLTAELVASELFGHERGSFTGAVRSHRGHFERAHQGTLFLDEITEMPLDTQAHLLRVLETGCVQRVGGEEERTVDVRLIAASNRDPGEATRKGLLRQDLYFRLRVFPIRLPPLRERGDDIRLLAEHFLDDLNERHGTHCTFAPPLMTAMLGHGWPGNVRELRNVVQRLHILADGNRLEGPINPDPVSSRRSPVPVGQSIRTVEKELILSTLEHYQGNRKSTADALGISVKTLYNRLQQYEREGGSEP